MFEVLNRAVDVLKSLNRNTNEQNRKPLFSLLSFLVTESLQMVLKINAIESNANMYEQICKTIVSRLSAVLDLQWGFISSPLRWLGSIPRLQKELD